MLSNLICLISWKKIDVLSNKKYIWEVFYEWFLMIIQEEWQEKIRMYFVNDTTLIRIRMILGCLERGHEFKIDQFLEIFFKKIQRMRFYFDGILSSSFLITTNKRTIPIIDGIIQKAFYSDEERFELRKMHSIITWNSKERVLPYPHSFPCFDECVHFHCFSIDIFHWVVSRASSDGSKSHFRVRNC